MDQILLSSGKIEKKHPFTEKKNFIIHTNSGSIDDVQRVNSSIHNIKMNSITDSIPRTNQSSLKKVQNSGKAPIFQSVQPILEEETPVIF